jgi:hypothetical protein
VVRLIARTMIGGAALATCGLSGCAGTYDLVTSQQFKDRPFHTLFHRDDPMEVLETVEEGDDRVRAMRDVKEPKQGGGTAADQDRLIAILQAGATTDRRPLCRLAAVDALSRFEDPRVGPILIAAYRNAPYDAPPVPGQPAPVTPAGAFAGVKGAVSNFTPDTVTTIQCHVLTALGKHRSVDGLKLLVGVVSARSGAKPAVQPAGGVSAADTPFTSETDRLDVRLAAIRALGQYENEPTAVQALVAILRDEKDVALRGRAHESLVTITGQDLEPDAKAWTEWLNAKR